MNRARKRSIEKIAESIRDECNVLDYGFQNIFESAEKIGFRIIRYPIGADSFLGFSMIKAADRIIFSNSSQILSREIFTVAHEIGHQKLHLPEQDSAVIKDDDFNDRNEYEVEANYFAACLLMPHEKIVKFLRLELNDKDIGKWNGLDIARIQTAFNASFDMVLIRLKELGKLDDSLIEKLKLDKMEHTISKLLWAIKGNTDLCQPTGVKKVPAEYLEWVIYNYVEKLIPFTSLAKALEYVGINAEDLEITLEQPPENKSLDDLLGEMD